MAIINLNLTEEEKKILFHKATEIPFSGEYDKYFESGVYTCKNCNSLLYHSKDKFDSGCGWPAFDDEHFLAITKIPDSDGVRTEIVCTNCGAHLGHIFIGEKLTAKNKRHCVNSLSLNFISEDRLGRIVVAAGCFWGVEHFFKKLDGVISAVSGYTGGNIINPTYQQVCSQNTGHYEAVQVIFDKQKTSLEKVIKYFFEIHDFEQENGQGPDIGDQYKSVIFYADDSTKSLAKSVLQELKDKNYKVATLILPQADFYKAEDYHQNYYQKNGKKPYCHFYRKIF
jgi:peptide methionine sulfoxide reductase msrA/msrB